MSPPVRKGDGTGVVPQDIAEVRTGDGRVLFGGAIPDSLDNQWVGSATGVSDGQTVDPWPDNIGLIPLNATGSPTLATSSVNGYDAVDLDGSNDAYTPDVSSNITEPFTMIFVLNLESLNKFDILWRQDGGDDQIRFDSSDIDLSFSGNTDAGGSPTTGDHIITFAVDDNTADLRQDGSEIADVNSSSNDVVIDGSSTGGFFADIGGDRRYIDGKVLEFNWYPTVKLSGSDLNGEESRLESKYDMSVL